MFDIYFKGTANEILYYLKCKHNSTKFIVEFEQDKLHSVLDILVKGSPATFSSRRLPEEDSYFITAFTSNSRDPFLKFFYKIRLKLFEAGKSGKPT